jgi:hypothetical protein
MRWIAASLVVLTLSARAPWVAAQSAPAAPASDAGTRAIQKGEEGLALYEQGNWSAALEHFREAERLYHSPVFALYVARTLRNSGRLLEARAAFRELVAERLEASAPELWRQAQEDGETELAAVEANIPTVVVVVDGGSQATEITVDDRPAAAGLRVELDPGPHRVVARDRGRVAVRGFTLAAGAREQSIRVAFPAPSAHLPPAALTPPPRGSGPYLPGLVVTGVGGAVLVAGGVVGLLALKEKNDTLDGLPASCRDKRCPLSEKDEIQPNVDKARHLGTAADVLLVSGAVVTAVGVGMIVLVPSGDSSVAVLASPRGGAVRLAF